MVAEGISEAASENQEKRERGRPTIWANPAERERELRENAPAVHTARGKNNRTWAEVGFAALAWCDDEGVLLADRVSGSEDEKSRWRALVDENEDRYRWILGQMPQSLINPAVRVAMSFVGKYEGRDIKQSILTELGRVASAHGKATARVLADQLCALEPKPTAKAAAAMLRAWRLEDQRSAKTADAIAVAEAVAKCLDDLRVRYPATSAEVLIDGLNIVFGYVDAECDPACE